MKDIRAFPTATAVRADGGCVDMYIRDSMNNWADLVRREVETLQYHQQGVRRELDELQTQVAEATAFLKWVMSVCPETLEAYRTTMEVQARLDSAIQ